jgi:hypothetical protein
MLSNISTLKVILIISGWNCEGLRRRLETFNSGQGLMPAIREQSCAISGSIRDKKFLDQTSIHHLSKIHPAPWIYVIFIYFLVYLLVY